MCLKVKLHAVHPNPNALFVNQKKCTVKTECVKMIYDVCLTRDLARAAAEIYVFIDDLIYDE